MIFFVADATLVLATGWQRRFSIAEKFQDEQKSLTKEQTRAIHRRQSDPRTQIERLYR
jgi:hypothetical protein